MGANRTGMTGQPQPMFSGQSVTPQPMFSGAYSVMNPVRQMPQQGQATNLWDLPTTALKMPEPPPTMLQRMRMGPQEPLPEVAYRNPLFANFGAQQPQPVEQPYTNPVLGMFRRPYG